MSTTDLKQAVLDSNPDDWDTDDVPDSFAYPNRSITVERIGEWSSAPAPWTDWSSGDTLQQAKYRLFHDGEPFDQIDLFALGDGTLVPLPDYTPPDGSSNVTPDEFVLSLNRYEEALGEIASTGDFDTTRQEIGLVIRDEQFRP